MRRSLLLVPVVLLSLAAAGCADGAVGAPGAVADVVDAFDGEHFGFVTAVSVDPPVVVVDPATWVTDDAEPNGYRIEDPGVAPVELPVAEGATIEVFRSSGDPATAATVTVAELADWFAGLSDPANEAAFEVTVADGELVELRFVYRP